MGGFGFGRMPGWPEGVNVAAPELGLRLLVIPELSVTAETLPLRLLGAGRVLTEALRELSKLPEEEELRLRAMPLVLRLRLMDTVDPASREKEELMQATEELFQDFQRRLLAQGETNAVIKLFQMRLDRPLTEAESQLVSERAARLGLERLERVVLQSSPAETARWLSDSQAT